MDDIRVMLEHHEFKAVAIMLEEGRRQLERAEQQAKADKARRIAKARIFPVGAKIAWRDFDDRYRMGVVCGYDMGRTKFQVHELIRGWGRNILCDHVTWVFVGRPTRIDGYV